MTAWGSTDVMGKTWIQELNSCDAIARMQSHSVTTIFYDFLRFSTIFYDFLRFSTIFYDFLRFSTIFYEFLRFSRIFLDFLGFPMIS